MNYFESQIEKIRPRCSAEIKTDLYLDQVVFHGKELSINPGTGSSFALLPTDNASGYFIYITKRVPLRASLNYEELKQHLLRIRLSTLPRINMAQAGKATHASSVETKENAYRTRCKSIC